TLCTSQGSGVSSSSSGNITFVLVTGCWYSCHCPPLYSREARLSTQSPELRCVMALPLCSISFISGWWMCPQHTTSKCLSTAISATICSKSEMNFTACFTLCFTFLENDSFSRPMLSSTLFTSRFRMIRMSYPFPPSLANHLEFFMVTSYTSPWKNQWLLPSTSRISLLSIVKLLSSKPAYLRSASSWL